MRRIGRWLGPSALFALAVVLVGRIALEPVRDLPRFDHEGMDPFHVVETYRIRDKKEPFTVAILGSSVSIWGIIPEAMAESLGQPRSAIRKLAIQGGTAFDMWHLVERNPSRFEGLKAAVVEINPRMFDDDTEPGRLRLTAAQIANYHERKALHLKSERWIQRADYFIPIYSVRRPLRDVILDIAHPSPQSPFFPKVAQRLEPFNPGWVVTNEDPAHHFFVTNVTAEAAAKRLYGRWRLSKLHDESFQKLMKWFQERNISVLLHQPPVHPSVAEHIIDSAKERDGMRVYGMYLANLGLEEETFFRPLSCLDCDIPAHGMRDQTHLNQLGARIYSSELGRRLKSIIVGQSGTFVD